MSGTSVSDLKQQLQAAHNDRLIREITEDLQLDDKLFTEARQRMEQAETPALCLTDRRSHDGSSDPEANSAYSLSRWRTRDRIKTQAAALVLCLNIGVDPPDVVKVSPCARLQCWVNPDLQHAQRNTKSIALALHMQYERWQPRAVYKVHPDPTVEDTKRLCREARHTARAERVLFHYNGHGVPQPTANGELWVFNKTFTQYIPVSIHDLASWLGSPSVYVLDCSHAGLLVDALKQPDAALHGHPRGHGVPGGVPLTRPVLGAGGHAQETIVLAACGANQLLPQDPDLCADIFTACLTTPIKVAMRWCHSRKMLVKDPATKDRIDRIPGRHTDRKTLLGELNWIFTSITDTIAWNMLPRALFQKLFRQDLLLASLFRNFMLAERVMKACGCQPVSSPRLPPMWQHPLWDTWDVHAEAALRQLPAVMADESKFVASSFFREQLTAFELWLNHSGGIGRSPPQQLPIVLQVLLSQVHRVRALHLLGRFLDMGSPCVELALSVGIFPYVLKLLQTTLPGLRRALVFIWCKILATDKQCQADIIKDNGQAYFMGVLKEPLVAAGAPAGGPGTPPTLGTLAECVFVLTLLCDGFPVGQAKCWEAGFLEAVVALIHEHVDVVLRTQAAKQHGGVVPAGGAAARPSAGEFKDWKEAIYDNQLLLAWCLLALGKLCDGQPEYVRVAVQRYDAVSLLQDVVRNMHDAELRASAVFALGCLIDTGLTRATEGEEEAVADARYAVEHGILEIVNDAAVDGSMLVRVECTIAIARAACIPVAGVSKRHSAFISQAFEAQHVRTMTEYSAHRNMFAYQPSVAGLGPASARRSQGSEPRAPVSEGGVPRSIRLGRHPDARQHGVTNARLDSRRQHSVDNRQSAPVSRTASASGLSISGPAHGSAAGSPRRSSSQIEASGKRVSNSRIIDKLTPHEEAGPLHNGSDRGDEGNGATSGHTSPASTPSNVSAHSQGPFTEHSPLRTCTPPADGANVASAIGPQDPPPDAPSEASTPGKRAETVYDRLADTLGLLVTDPAPSVAQYGKLALLASGHDISHLPSHDAGTGMGAPALGRPSSSASAPFATLHSVDPATLSHASGGFTNGKERGTATSASSVCSSDLPSAAKREPWLWSSLHRRLSSTVHRLAAPAGGPRGGPAQPQHPAPGPPGPASSSAGGRARSPAATVSPSTPAVQPAVPPSAAAQASRGLATIITPVRGAGLLGAQPALPDAMPGPAPSPPTANAASAAPAQTGQPWPAPSAQRPGRIPPSVVYRRLCQHFRRPMKLGRKQRPEAVLTINVSAAHWGVIDKIERKMDQKLATLESLRGQARQCRAATQPRLNDSVQTLRTSSRGASAVVLHAIEDALTAVDTLGVVHVMSHKPDRDPAAYHHNCYHVTSGLACEPRAAGQAPVGQACTVVAAHILNGLEWPMLMACAADGAVRIWARHMHPKEQKLVTAWQAVELHQSFFRTPDPTVYHFQPLRQCLCAIGGTDPNSLAVWDLHRESCVQVISQGIDVGGVHTTSHLRGADLSGGAPVLLSGSSDGCVRVFDTRAAHRSGADLQFRTHDGALTGLAVRPSGIVATASQGQSSSEIHFSDIRVVSSSEGDSLKHSVFKREDNAHKSGRLTTLEAHPNAPMFASGNATQVVKMWSEAGEVLTAIRAKSHRQGQVAGIGRTTCMSFAPFELKLATGASDAHCSVYSMSVDAPGTKEA